MKITDLFFNFTNQQRPRSNDPFICKLIFAMDPAINSFAFNGVELSHINHETDTFGPSRYKPPFSEIPLVLKNSLSGIVNAQRSDFSQEEIKETLYQFLGEDAPFFEKIIQKFQQKTDKITNKEFIKDYFNTVNNYFNLPKELKTFDFTLITEQERKNAFLFEYGVKEDVVMRKFFFQFLPSFYARVYFPSIDIEFQVLATSWNLNDTASKPWLLINE